MFGDKKRINYTSMKLVMNIDDVMHILDKRLVLFGTLKEDVFQNQKIVIKTNQGEWYERKIVNIMLSSRFVDQACAGENAGLVVKLGKGEHLKNGSQVYTWDVKEKNGGMGNMRTKDIDYENFDLDEEFKKVQEEEIPNIFVCGASKVGKSSLINKMFNLTGDDAARVGEDGAPTTRGVKVYRTDNMNLYDSEGYETGEEQQRHYFKDILEFVRCPDSCIHEVWYCVNASGKRYLDIDRKIVEEIRKEQIPVMIILTKVDNIAMEDLENLNSDIEKMSPGVPRFTYSTSDAEPLKPYVQREQIIEWALEHLREESGMRERLLNHIICDLDEKNGHIIKAVIPKYVALAGVAVTASSFFPVPFADSAVLMALQVKMATHIMKSYNLDYNKNIVVDLVSASGLSMVGKTLAGQLAGIIPGIGGAAKGVANVTVATTVTATVGVAISHLSCMYLKKCVESNGKSNMEFSDYMTEESLGEAIEWAKNSGIIEGIISAWKNGSGKKGTRRTEHGQN